MTQLLAAAMRSRYAHAVLRSSHDAIELLLHLQETSGQTTGEEHPQDLEQQLQHNTEELRRMSTTQTGVGIATTPLGPLAVPSSAQEEATESRQTAEAGQAGARQPTEMGQTG